MKKFIITSGLLLVSLLNHAHACSAVSPSSVFVYHNDDNKDGYLTYQEYKKAKLNDNLYSTKKLGGWFGFKKLDTNKDKRLDFQEINFIHYTIHPCADWEKKMANGN